jgi:bile acid:Na+ symporter, BASS family
LTSTWVEVQRYQRARDRPAARHFLPWLLRLIGLTGLNSAGDWLADHIAPAAAIAVVLGLALPAASLARRSDLLLGALVLFTAMLIEPRRLLGLRRQVVPIVVLSVGTLLVLTLVAWLIGRAFSGDVRDGILSLGLASTEVASLGLISLAGGDSVLALGVLTGSLIAAAVLGPLLAGLLASASGHASTLSLLGRFSLVVLAPLAAGLAIRGLRPALARSEGSLNGLSALTVCVLLYAALSGAAHGHELAQAVVGSAVFMLAAGVVALAVTRVIGSLDPLAVALTCWLRDFAVAAALASQAFGSASAGVAGIYGALMLLAGAVTATILRRRNGALTIEVGE